MRTLLLLIDMLLAVAIVVLVLAHKGGDAGLGTTIGRGQSAVERPVTRALVLAIGLWLAVSALAAACG